MTAVVVEVDAHEGPVHVPVEDALYFTSVPAPDVAIKRLSLASGEVSVLRADANQANGMALHPDGRLVVCEQGTHVTPARISLVDRVTGAAETLVDGWGGLPLNSPNDVVVKGDGTVWFTDPSYGYLQGFRPAAAARRLRLPPRPGHGRDDRGGRGLRQAQRPGLLARRAHPLHRRLRLQRADPPRRGLRRRRRARAGRAPRAGRHRSRLPRRDQGRRRRPRPRRLLARRRGLRPGRSASRPHRRARRREPRLRRPESHLRHCGHRRVDRDTPEPPKER